MTKKCWCVQYHTYQLGTRKPTECECCTSHPWLHSKVRKTDKIAEMTLFQIWAVALIIWGAVMIVVWLIIALAGGTT